MYPVSCRGGCSLQQQAAYHYRNLNLNPLSRRDSIFLIVPLKTPDLHKNSQSNRRSDQRKKGKPKEATLRNECVRVLSIQGTGTPEDRRIFPARECKLRFKYELERASRFRVTCDLGARAKQRGENNAKRIRKNCIRLRSRSIFIRVEFLLRYSSRGSGLGKHGFHSRNTYTLSIRSLPRPVSPFFRINRMQMRSRQ